MKQTIQSIVVASIALTILSTSCTKGKDVAGGGSGAQANTIKGTIYDAKGNKYAIDNSNVIIHMLGPGTTAYHVNMDNTSHYEQKVDNGLFTFDARAWLSLNGKVISISLDPVDGKSPDTKFDSGPGVTKDFRLKLTGLIPGSDPSYADSYYGAKVVVLDGAYFFGAPGNTDNLAAKYPGSTVLFTFTPKSPCVDGSNAPTTQINCPVENLLSSSRYLVNFPLARYYLSALLKKPSGQQYPLRLNFTNAATGPHYDLVDLTFSPATNDQNCNPGTPRVAVWEN